MLLWLHIMLRTFSCTFGYSCVIFCEMYIPSFCPFIIWLLSLSWNIFRNQALFLICILQKFLSVGVLYFNFINIVFFRIKILIFIDSNLSYFPFVVSAFVSYLRILYLLHGYQGFLLWFLLSGYPAVSVAFTEKTFFTIELPLCHY